MAERRAGLELERIIRDALERAGFTVQYDERLDREVATDAIVKRPDGVLLRLQVTRRSLRSCLVADDGRSISKASRFLRTARDERVRGMRSVFLIVHGLDGEEQSVMPRVVQLLSEIDAPEPVLVYFGASCRSGLVAPLADAIRAAARGWYG